MSQPLFPTLPTAPSAAEPGALARGAGQEFFWSVFDAAPVAMATTRERRLLQANRRFLEMFGWSRDELIALPEWPMVGRPKDDDETCTVGQSLAERRPVELERELRRRDGSAFWARVRAVPVEGAGSQRGVVVWVVEDLSEQWRGLQRLQQRQRELEARVQERSEALGLANAQLRQEIEDRQVAEEQLRHLAEHDRLTGLPNRRVFEVRLQQALRDAEAQDGTVALLYMDLDRFKTINDSLGHVIGDRLLRRIAERARRSLRSGDTMTRLGGDEFVMLLPSLRGAGDAALVASQLIEEVSRPYLLEGLELRVTPAVGISLFPDHGRDGEALIAQASAAMYQAKSKGLRNYLFYAGESDAPSSQRLLLENDLHRAIERGEFVLDYQPRYELGSGRLCACEALLRWQHPARGRVSPAEFIPLAEETGLVVAIGEWVLRECCRQIARWAARGLRLCPVSVNLSARQFHRVELLGTLRSALDETGIDPRLLEVEITETTLMHNTDETLAILEQLHRLGIKVSVDDFGTGYSSLAYLKRFPVDLLKIDRSFVNDVVHDADDAVIVSAIIGLARSLQLRVVAEGVETSEQVEFLKRRGCDEVQGFWFSRPLPPAELEPLFGAP
ncbi:putative bifunctional diguanylate cyclase/phosphodiesterase [Caldimonas brevitalea]|uniref:Diguanylate cyclase/phosphodiesterase n=1 Tax=Caldimonas brevitalea TaxID=413882 RepID=A0A0G3BK42_9BURK|nr:EAL domain-containing protein [Caldimonas brevitalea]AKJ26910.1 diguanylate cyclase/phosphodiesterase [Caldimonas brevitalea]